MSANLNVLTPDNLVGTTGGGAVGHRLHSEREEICDALLRQSAPSYENSGAKSSSNERAMNAVNWHRELLQARLKKVDHALDRLVSGSYGECSQCGKWIEDTKLDFDPAIADCLGCWDRLQPIISFSPVRRQGSDPWRSL
jgi:RNA polymerase-binding transcription factor DksA